MTSSLALRVLAISSNGSLAHISSLKFLRRLLEPDIFRLSSSFWLERKGERTWRRENREDTASIRFMLYGSKQFLCTFFQ